jgi:predicted RNA binding protein YcfA (HicA-like mRNA interferase family)
MKRWKLFRRILSGDANIPFRDVVAAVEAFGFHLVRVNGSHHIFARDDIPKLLNLQNRKGKAKPYQIRQFILLVEEYNLDMEEEE